MSCVVKGCKSHSSRKNTQELVTFHRFPKNNTMKNEWIHRIARENWTPKTHSHVCSKHFTLDSYKGSDTTKYRRLNEDAVPALFIINDTRDPLALDDSETKPSTSFQLIQLNESAEPLRSCEGTSQNSQMTGTHSEIQFIRRIKMLEKKLKKAKMISKRRLTKINTLHKRLSRLGKKNEDLFSILMKKFSEDDDEIECTMLD